MILFEIKNNKNNKLVYINPEEISSIYAVRNNPLDLKDNTRVTKIVLKDESYYLDSRLLIDFIDDLKKSGIKIIYSNV